MARETIAQKKEREENEKSEISIETSTRTIVTFKGSRYEEEDGEYATYTVSFEPGSEVVAITAPCGDERYFKRSALVKLSEALAGK